MLGAESQLSFEVTRSVRHATVVGGDAYFAVTRDPARPFTVSIGDVQVRVVGTQFEIRRRSGEVSVAVAEGTVDVSRTDAAGAAVRLHRGRSSDCTQRRCRDCSRSRADGHCRVAIRPARLRQRRAARRRCGRESLRAQSHCHCRCAAGEPARHDVVPHVAGRRNDRNAASRAAARRRAAGRRQHRAARAPIAASRRMRLAIRIVVAAVATLTVAIAHARERRAETKRNFQIAAQPLSQALLEFSRQADVIVTAPSELVREQACAGNSRRAHALRGARTVASRLGTQSFFHRVRRDHDRRGASLRSSTSDCRCNLRATGDSPTDVTGDALIEEVLVTAQKRTENVQDVPVLGQRVRQPARAAASRDDDPRLRRLHSRLERQQRRRSGPDDDHAARDRARRSGRRRRLLRRRHAARLELQLRRRARVRPRSHAVRRRAHRSAARAAGNAVRRRRDGRLAQIRAAPSERERLRGMGRRGNVRHLVCSRIRLGRACRRERAARGGSRWTVGQLLRTADTRLRGQRSHRRAGRERRRPARWTSRVAVADQ